MLRVRSHPRLASSVPPSTGTTRQYARVNSRDQRALRSAAAPALISFRPAPPPSARARHGSRVARMSAGFRLALARDTPLRLRSEHSSAPPPFRSRAANDQTGAVNARSPAHVPIIRRESSCSLAR